MIVVVDTNVWVSSFINRNGYPATLRAAWLAGRFSIAVSPPLLDELAEVMRRPRLRRFHKASDEQLETFLNQLVATALFVETTGQVRLCRDPKDDFVLETAILSGANYLVSRDDDIKRDPDLALHLVRAGVQAISVHKFLDMLAMSDNPE